MFRFFAVIVSLVLFTTDSFAACSAGYYEESVDITFPTTPIDSYGCYSHDGSYKYHNTSPVNLSAGQWSVTWTSGSVKGTAVGESSCNGTGGKYMVTTSPSDSMSNSANGRYCWCKVTQWIPNSGSSQNLSAMWVLSYGYNSAGSCARSCARDCGEDDIMLRNVMFRSVGATCEQCPDGGTSTGTGGITNCYIPSTTNFTDSKGTYHFTEACYYTE